MQLDDLIENSFRLNPQQKEALKKLRLTILRDLLLYLPSRYGDVAEVKHIAELKTGELAVISGRVLKNEIKKGFHSKIPIAEVTIEDETGRIKAVWFHQAYMAKKVSEGSLAKLTGTVAERKGARYIANGELEEVEEIELAHKNSLFNKNEITRTPVYPESRGVTSNWFHHAIKKLVTTGLHETIVDPIGDEILTKYHLPGLKTAIVWIHFPRSDGDALSARKRFSFEEIFFIQLARQIERASYRSNPTFKLNPDPMTIDNFLARFDFKPTEAQTRSINQILKDMSSNQPMTRLLEGDVGSGKTAVAATVSYSTIVTHPVNTNGKKQDFGALQIAYMAPTEILAKQHFESFIQYFKHLGINIGLLTGSGCFKFPSKINPGSFTPISRAQLLKWCANGEIPILIGTHALIQKSVKFKHLALVIIDEQHRFGVEQRFKIARKSIGTVPHLLSMTATPIPRTLALTIYGDLDLSLLDEMPEGRKQVITEVVLKADRQRVYEAIRRELKNGRQAYIICPRIDEPDPTKEMAINAKSVKEEAKRLQKDIFPEFEVGVVHGKLNPKAKDAVMKDFSEGKINILVATSVIEVGVNVPNATIIIIEGAERFGLAQLHQLRGRVIRSNHQAYCYVFSDSQSEKTMDRLSALKTAKNGFELAELDLQLRGIGELSGSKQWGISDIGMEAIKNLKMVEAARNEVVEILKIDPALTNHQPILEKLNTRPKPTHFE
ncbi:MAG: ATP-dependent DNA helicase RecG [Candidatus Vogelbacteria bacterium]|nr:ATP-dependent DNA helicase RecG [Candidatus Vogelbacteria bacterium]